MNDTPDLVSVHLTQQQIELLERLKQRGDFGAEYSEVILNCFRKYVEQFLGEGRFGNVGKRLMAVPYGEMRDDFVLEPVSGKALPVYEVKRFGSSRKWAGNASTSIASTCTTTGTTCRSVICAVKASGS